MKYCFERCLGIPRYASMDLVFVERFVDEPKFVGQTSACNPSQGVDRRVEQRLPLREDAGCH
jgi:hypothetical protein